MSDRELKPCPFCSGEAKLIYLGECGQYDDAVVRCTVCGAESPDIGMVSGYQVAMGRAVSLWNTRALLALTPAPTPAREGVDRLDEEGYLWKWVERALFDKHLGTRNCLDVIARHPAAPWNKGRWDVDHKPYAKQFYAAFPKAEAALTPTPPTAAQPEEGALALLKIGSKVRYISEDIDLSAEVIGHIEGWYELRFSDNSTTVVRPSHVHSEVAR